jgi:hypothetical protein
MIEEVIDTYPTLSYMNLNQGDQKLIDDFQSRRTRATLKFLGSTAFTIVVAILSSKLEKLL